MELKNKEKGGLKIKVSDYDEFLLNMTIPQDFKSKSEGQFKYNNKV